MNFVNIFGANQLIEEIENGHVIGCGHCGSKFEEDDKAFAINVGECPYCHHLIERGLTQ